MSELPALTYNFLSYFESFDNKNKILVEIGSGESTIYWQNRFKTIYSYDNDAEYLNIVNNKIDKTKTSLFLFDRNIFSNLDFRNHISVADYIIIDNNPNFIDRFYFCRFARQFKKDDSVIILDNGESNRRAYEYLIRNFYCKDFPGKNKKEQITVTSVFGNLREQPL